MAVYKPHNDNQIITPERHSGNQRVLTGLNPELLSAKGVFFLDTLIVSTGVTITDGKNNQVGAGITSFASDHAPLRLDYGIKITGTVLFAKGYLVEGCLPS